MRIQSRIQLANSVSLVDSMRIQSLFGRRHPNSVSCSVTYATNSSLGASVQRTNATNAGLGPSCSGLVDVPILFQGLSVPSTEADRKGLVCHQIVPEANSSEEDHTQLCDVRA